MSSSHSTPSKAATAKSKSKASSSSRSSSRMFTPVMQDRQARNKDPYASTDESSDSAWEGQNRKFDVYSRDSFARIQRRREAAIVLDNPELLMMHAQARSDSIPGTRHYFTKILCGYEDEKDPYAPPGVEIYEKPKFRPSKEANETKRSM
ncbi:uncharacterized protein K444DRAFT_590145 [Hyaloscypha bicolor E]|uniref:Uncharacterized protein n=1 Tax=Hyaloscypha bicolor E TaxID=1095630 RepID=A0A2J6T9R5_9HELO|nr:uncharacterized protein K444DRAFT_590145 [Hyaloscypha bicolor E]PMD59749.1 hypothetical protein K444DRAFT_590145 [Hyaloscypha bicolor E]